MTASISTQPADSTATIGNTHSFSVVATTTGTASYEWFIDGVSQGTGTATLSAPVATLNNSYALVYVVVGDDDDNTFVSSSTVFAISQTAGPMTQHSMVFNYDDNNFTWKDPAIEIDVVGQYALYDVTYQTYGFTPGWQQRWNDWKDGGVSGSTWADAQEGETNAARWSETAARGTSKQIMQIAKGDLYQADQVINRQDSLKRFYATRTQIDFDDLVPAWTTNNIKYTKSFVFHMQADQRFIAAARDNTIDFYVGWAQNLMEDPNWRAAVPIKLEDRASGGKYKIDYRSSGRYLSMSFDLTNSTQLAFTGGDIDVQQAGGR